MRTAQRKYEDAMYHLSQAQRLMGGVMYALGSDGSDVACLDGCFENVAAECEEVAQYQLGLQSKKLATVRLPDRAKPTGCQHQPVIVNQWVSAGPVP